MLSIISSYEEGSRELLREGSSSTEQYNTVLTRQTDTGFPGGVQTPAN